MAAYSNDPIVAIATASGRGGIGVVRVSGINLEPLVHAFFGRVLEARRAYYLPFDDAEGNPIDIGIALFFKGPNSYTGEDVLELQGHGGPAVLRRLLARSVEVGHALGLRHAHPGEFTRRAFLNERLDLAQAEAVADLIDASSEAAARSAMASLSGVFSAGVNALAERIIHLRMLVEATLDFPEEEIDFLEKYQARALLAAILDDLDTMVRQARQGMVLREGLHVVLAGRPNVGKSSLLNALAGDDVAIVTPIAGTTRDRVIQQIHVQGVPIHIVDTAGLRDTDDAVESLGIARTWAEIEKAGVIVHIQDARAPDDVLDTSITERLPARTPVLNVLNKIDLLDSDVSDTGTVTASDCPVGKLSSTAIMSSGTTPRTTSGITTNTEPDTLQPVSLEISAKTGVGLDSLREKLLEIAGWNPDAQSPWLARERHLSALDDATGHLLLADGHARDNDQALDLFAEELRLAHDALCSITGQFTSDDLLGEIFSSFCIGK